ncbi:hypothetical protein GL218_09576 [Daldinia childiae]|uniref:uncharacterized protein n=1 Tax=Daldinia childiae TaxID=326645 RepID=UPI0014484AB1|nr:uncharacterized protein GL218_09576 [Daldinia childiae]KAF3058943.1 hypothetical protein GL218_09576 [Daldinia childiae]
MANRPNFIDLRADSSASVNSSASRPLRSPRLHVAGEVPPALSPLDAFAAQSRLLAKQLEDSAKTGRRMSRLPPLTTESPLIVQGRSEYFRSMSYDSSEERPETPQQNTGLGLTTEVESPSERPVSMQPSNESHRPPLPPINRSRCLQTHFSKTRAVDTLKSSRRMKGCMVRGEKNHLVIWKV